MNDDENVFSQERLFIVNKSMSSFCERMNGSERVSILIAIRR